MFHIRAMTIGDYDAVVTLMCSEPGVCLRDSDSRPDTARYLERNPGLSLVAEISHDVAGCVLCGHDGRRGYLRHLVVRPSSRRLGIGTALVGRCLASLESIGIHKTHIEVLRHNQGAIAFWEKLGWVQREDIRRYSLIQGAGDNA
ncbi:MAG: GNAT family N-acetyltransferase [Gammaproteobacteria bacterium]|nr:GNAT family N-acetyltransferase [Gammaproteobacteria bacterium]